MGNDPVNFTDPLGWEIYPPDYKGPRLHANDLYYGEALIVMMNEGRSLRGPQTEDALRAIAIALLNSTNLRNVNTTEWFAPEDNASFISREAEVVDLYSIFQSCEAALDFAMSGTETLGGACHMTMGCDPLEIGFEHFEWGVPLTYQYEVTGRVQCGAANPTYVRIWACEASFH